MKNCLEGRTFKQVVTHPGQAHRDDFLACSIALMFFTSICAVFRRNPTKEEMADPETLVLDVGEEYDIEKGNFDHHQLARDAEPECALSLFLGALGLRETFELMAWFTATKIMDSKGPMALAKHLGLASPDAIFKNLSPIEGGLVGLFEKQSTIEDSSLLAHIMRLLGGDLLEYANVLRGQIEWLSANARMVDIGSVPAMLVESSNTEGTQQFRDSKCPGVGISISWDDRGAGWALYRFNDHPAVDFSRLEGDPAILFAHKGGFIAKTRERLPMDEVLALVKRALK